MRLFVAVWPSPSVIEDLRGLDRPPHPGVRWTMADQWHVTLRFVGDLEDPEPLISRVRGAASQVGPTVAEMGPRSGWLGPSVLCLPVHGLDAVAAAVRTATGDLGEPERPDFHGHLTLARARRGAAPVLKRLPAVELASSWPVEEITVVASALGGTGSTYTVVGHAPLRRP